MIEVAGFAILGLVIAGLLGLALFRLTNRNPPDDPPWGH